MKKTLLSLAALTVAGTVLAQVPFAQVSPKAVRTYGDTVDTGFVTVFGTTAGAPVPACGALPPVRGTGLIGHSVGRHAVICHVIFDKAELNAARAAAIAGGGSGEMSILLENPLNSNTLGHTVRVGLTNMNFSRVILEGAGPFNIRPAAGNDWMNLIHDGAEGKILAQASTTPWTLRTDPVSLATTTTAFGNQLIPLASGGSGGGGGVLDVCLGPTGQVRIIDPGNNGDWATECVANGWRATTIALGAAPVPTAWDEALASPSPGALNTFQVTCGAALFAVGVNQQIATPVADPLGLTFTQVDSANIDHRAAHFFTPGTAGLQILSQNPLPGFARIKMNVY